MYLIHIGTITPNPITCKYLSLIVEFCQRNSLCLGLLISGGAGFCYRELLRAKSYNLKVLAITNWIDDIFSIKLLKDLDFFIGGTWRLINSVAIGGIDGKEVYQSINRLIKEYNNIKQTAPSIILSYHPARTICDEVLNLHIGLDAILELISKLNIYAILSSHISISDPCVSNKNNTIVVVTPPLERGIYTCIDLDTWDVRFEYANSNKRSN